MPRTRQRHVAGTETSYDFIAQTVVEQQHQRRVVTSKGYVGGLRAVIARHRVPSAAECWQSRPW